MSVKSDGAPLPPEPEAIDPDPVPGEVFYTNAFRNRPHLKPSDVGFPIGVQADPDESGSLIGIAYGTACIGGVSHRIPRDQWADAPPPEQVWRLELDRYWADGRTFRLNRKRTLDGRFVLRLGRFVELAEEAV